MRQRGLFGLNTILVVSSGSTGDWVFEPDATEISSGTTLLRDAGQFQTAALLSALAIQALDRIFGDRFSSP